MNAMAVSLPTEEELADAKNKEECAVYVQNCRIVHDIVSKAPDPLVMKVLLLWHKDGNELARRITEKHFDATPEETKAAFDYAIANRLLLCGNDGRDVVAKRNTIVSQYLDSDLPFGADKSRIINEATEEQAKQLLNALTGCCSLTYEKKFSFTPDQLRPRIDALDKQLNEMHAEDAKFLHGLGVPAQYEITTSFAAGLDPVYTLGEAVERTYTASFPTVEQAFAVGFDYAACRSKIIYNMPEKKSSLSANVIVTNDKKGGFSVMLDDLVRICTKQSSVSSMRASEKAMSEILPIFQSVFPAE